MATPEKLSQLLAEYTALLGTGKDRALTGEELQHLELLRDVLLETGAILEAEAANQPRRTPRAAVVAEVSFATAQDAARAYTRTREVGTGGMALLTSAPLPRGSTLELTLQVAGWPTPMSVLGEVVWCRDGAVGVAFRNLAADEARRLRVLVAEHSSFLDRLRGALANRGAQPIPATVSTRRVIIMRLQDPALSEAVSVVLGHHGFFVTHAAADDVPPSLIVADGDADFVVPTAAKHPHVPIVLVNVAGAESLMGRLMQVRPAAYVKKPATPAEILQAVQAVLRGR